VVFLGHRLLFAPSSRSHHLPRNPGLKGVEVLAAFAAPFVGIVNLENILYNINMLNNCHLKTASRVNLFIDAGIW